jgi:hypothetical protein
MACPYQIVPARVGGAYIVLYVCAPLLAWAAHHLTRRRCRRRGIAATPAIVAAVYDRRSALVERRDSRARSVTGLQNKAYLWTLCLLTIPRYCSSLYV